MMKRQQQQLSAEGDEREPALEGEVMLWEILA
jgi:hypothetical protein